MPALLDTGVWEHVCFPIVAIILLLIVRHQPIKLKWILFPMHPSSPFWNKMGCKNKSSE